MKKVNNTEQLKNVAKKTKVNIKKVKKENPAQKIVKKEKGSLTELKKIVQPAATNGAEIKKEPVELDAKVLAKIEKKKAKKLAKKLAKKSGKKLETSAPKTEPLIKSENPTTAEESKEIVPKGSKKKELTKPIAQKKGQKKDKKKKASQELEEEKERGPRDPLLAAATVFVGNLPITTKRVQIVKLFAKYGGIKGIRLRTASGQVIFKHKQRKQAGSLNAYVILNDVESAKKALELNGTEFKGSHLRITPADAQKTQSGHDPKRTLFVGNLKYSANDKKLHEIFSNCGEIDYIRCLGNGKNGCNGVAYVCFKSPEAVGLGLELNETLLDERPIHVERYSVKKLGAKEARDRQAAATQKPKTTGAKKRIDGKQQKGAKPGKAENSLEKKKKSDYHGVKSSGIKKKTYNKKPNNEMRGLAKKIAPKIKKEK